MGRGGWSSGACGHRRGTGAGAALRPRRAAVLTALPAPRPVGQAPPCERSLTEKPARALPGLWGGRGRGRGLHAGGPAAPIAAQQARRIPCMGSSLRGWRTVRPAAASAPICARRRRSASSRHPPRRGGRTPQGARPAPDAARRTDRCPGRPLFGDMLLVGGLPARVRARNRFPGCVPGCPPAARAVEREAFRPPAPRAGARAKHGVFCYTAAWRGYRVQGRAPGSDPLGRVTTAAVQAGRRTRVTELFCREHLARSGGRGVLVARAARDLADVKTG